MDKKKPQLGDLIEIFRGTYQHWGIYVGDGYIIHLAPPYEYAQAGAYSMMSVLSEKALVKKELLEVVAGDDKYIINNLLDDEYEPRPVYDILQEAKSLVGEQQNYCLFRDNCEHFVTNLRYGKAESRQVRRAVNIGIGLGVATLVLAGAAAFISSLGNKEKKRTQ